MHIEMQTRQLLSQAIDDLKNRFPDYDVVSMQEDGDKFWKAAASGDGEQCIGENSAIWNFVLRNSNAEGIANPQAMTIIEKPIAKLLYGDSSFGDQHSIEYLAVAKNDAPTDVAVAGLVDQFETNALDATLIVYLSDEE